MATALMKAMKGEAVSDRQTKTALEEAVGKITTLQKSAKQAKEELAGALEKATHAVVFTAETQATIFGFSMVEGYRGGPDRMQLGKVDVRAPLGLAGLGYGLVGCFMDLPGSAHALAVSNGITGSLIASLGAQAGLALAEKRGAVPAPAPAPVMQGMDLGGPVRQVVLTPEPSVDGDDYGDFGRQRRGGGRSRGRSRQGQSRGDQGGGSEEHGGQSHQDAMRMKARRIRAMRRGGQGGSQGGRDGQGGWGRRGGQGGQGGQGRGFNRFRQGPQQAESYEDEQAA